MPFVFLIMFLICMVISAASFALGQMIGHGRKMSATERAALAVTVLNRGLNVQTAIDQCGTKKVTLLNRAAFPPLRECRTLQNQTRSIQRSRGQNKINKIV